MSKYATTVVLLLVVVGCASACPLGLSGNCYAPQAQLQQQDCYQSPAFVAPIIQHQYVAPLAVTQGYGYAQQFRFGYGQQLALGAGYGGVAVRQRSVAFTGFHGGFGVAPFRSSVVIRGRGPAISQRIVIRRR